jgi:hypothetical protein
MGLSVRIGAGAGFADDRIDPAVDLAERGALDYLVFECLAERTLALAQLDRRRDPAGGYDPLLRERMTAVLATCVANGVVIVTNAGAANPLAAAAVVAEVARAAGLSGLRIAAVLGDDVRHLVSDADSDPDANPDPDRDPDSDSDDVGANDLSANAYLGCEAIVTALQGGAHVVVTGRVADASLFVGPLVHALGWSATDWDRMGTAVAVGHLLECAGQVCGGYFADPGVTDVADLAHLGFPIAEVTADGSVAITKLPGTGGEVTVRTCTEQLLYEIHDPRGYLTPDVVADFSTITFDQVAPDRVALSGAAGRPRPDLLKVSVGSSAGFVGEGEISYAGAGCLRRARLATDILTTRLGPTGLGIPDLRFELIGVDAVHRGGGRIPSHEPPEVRLRVVGRAADEAGAARVGREVTGLLVNGPAGGGGARRRVFEQIALRSTYLARDQIRPSVEWLET